MAARDRPGGDDPGGVRNGSIVSGCVANASADCVGVSNVFSNFDQDVFADASQTIAAVFPHMPLTGYMRRSNLASVQNAGFEPVGDLRIVAAKHP